MKVHKSIFDINHLRAIDLCSGKATKSPAVMNWKNVTCKNCLKKRGKK